MYPLINSVCVFAFALPISASISDRGHFPGDKFGIEKMSAKLPLHQGDGIIGDWKLSLETFDENSNKKLDKKNRARLPIKITFTGFTPMANA